MYPSIRISRHPFGGMPMSLSTDNLSPSCKADVRVKFRNRCPSTDMLFLAEPKFTMDRDAVAKVAQQCNMLVFQALFPSYF